MNFYKELMEKTGSKETKQPKRTARVATVMKERIRHH